jgi:PIN domain nuclease of toxin-antitoxin system
MGSQSVILDTHVLVWFFEGDERLGSRTRAHIEQATDEHPILVSAITPWEIALLVKKSRISLGIDVGRWIGETLGLPGIVLADLDPEIAIDSVNLPGDFHNDPADRLIIATARHHKIPLLTVDRAILDYGALGHVNVIDARI